MIDKGKYLRSFSKHNFLPPTSFAMAKLAGVWKWCSEIIQTISFGRYCLYIQKTISTIGYCLNPFTIVFSPPATFAMVKIAGGRKLCFRRFQRKSFGKQCFLHQKSLCVEGFSSNSSTRQFSTTGNFHHGKINRWWKVVLLKDSKKILWYTMSYVSEDIVYRRILSKSFDNFFSPPVDFAMAKVAGGGM